MTDPCSITLTSIGKHNGYVLVKTWFWIVDPLMLGKVNGPKKTNTHI